MKYTKQEQAESIAMLKDWLKDGDEVYTINRHTSKSGMMRHIDVVAFKVNDTTKQAQPVWLSYHVARALDWPQVKGDNSLKVSGCGMDMGFHTVYTLGRVLGINLTQRWL